MQVVTRFAPSPTGFLHIGGARTALFNWLFAKHHGGKFHLRIEDTDRARSTDEAIDAILDGLKWLGLEWDDKPVFQHAQADRHINIAKELIEAGKAYYCYTSPEELDAHRQAAREAGKHVRFQSPWRNPEGLTPPADRKPVVRLKAPLEGSITLQDTVQGEVTVSSDQLDDMVLLRSDNTPTYMLAVVVDDHDMGITHIIRGDDHLTNAFRQAMLYEALGWDIPAFSHIPLIHGADGAKLSKRHGALGVEAYRDMGYLPEAMRNYLLRLGWSHGDDEIISTEDAIKWFNTDHIGKSPSRLDLTKLENVNGHYIREAHDADLLSLVLDVLSAEQIDVDDTHKKRLLAGMDGLKQRAKNTKELTESSKFYINHDIENFEEKAQNQLINGGLDLITELLPSLIALEDWSPDAIQETAKTFGEEKSLKLGKVMGPLRAAITGSTTSPSMFEVMSILGKEETLQRLKNAHNIKHSTLIL